MILNRFAPLGVEEQMTTTFRAWQSISTMERVVFNKFLMGSLKLNCSLKELESALWMVTGIDQTELAHRLAKPWIPTAEAYQELITPEKFEGSISLPYPIRNFEEGSISNENLNPSDWHAEWIWIGQRVQIVKRKGFVFIWTDSQDLVNDRFPELTSQANELPDGTVMDGWIVSIENEGPSGMSMVRKRLGKQIPSSRLLSESPVGFIAFDLLEWDGQDVRGQNLSARRALLKGCLDQVHRDARSLLDSPFDPWHWMNMSVMGGAPPMKWDGPIELLEYLRTARSNSAEGILLRRYDSWYDSGEMDWLAVLDQPVQLDAVLMYVQMTNVNDPRSVTEYTLGVWNGDNLVTIGKFLGNLPAPQQRSIADYARANTLERFGPVRTVLPELVFRIEFDSVEPSSRHKAGLVLKGARIVRWEMDKRPGSAGTLAAIQKLLP